MGKIKAINISNLGGENTFYVNQAILNKNKGIINDRYYGNFKNSYEQVTFIAVSYTHLTLPTTPYV